MRSVHEEIVVHYLFIKQPARTCEGSPMSNYILEIKSLPPEVHELSIMLEENMMRVNSLLENTVYTFKVLVSNTRGTISTNSTQICELQLTLAASIFIQ